jgi:hypothetical protein
VRSIFGESETWAPVYERDFLTEYAAGYPLSLSGFGTVLKALVAPLPRLPWDTSAGSARIEYDVFEKGGELFGANALDYARFAEAKDKFDNERWFLINGICTDRRVAELNAYALFNMFERPITTLYNACNGVLLDLLECAVGKEWDATTDAARIALPELLEALRDDKVKRVVLISHSQGTIVAAVLLKALEELLVPSHRGHQWNRHEASPEREVARKLARSVDMGGKPSNVRRIPRVQPCLKPEQIAKLEMFNFANCATSMEPFVAVGDNPTRLAPFIESYGNEYDLVARLGMLAPTHGTGSARIGGDKYLRKNTWGHLLNAHYLYDFWQEHKAKGCARPSLEPFAGNLRRKPKLFDYMDGAGAIPRELRQVAE